MGFAQVTSSLEHACTVTPDRSVVCFTSSKNPMVTAIVPAGGAGAALTEPRHDSGPLAAPGWQVFATQTVFANAAPRLRQSSVLEHCWSSVFRSTEHAGSDASAASATAPKSASEEKRRT